MQNERIAGEGELNSVGRGRAEFRQTNKWKQINFKFMIIRLVAFYLFYFS